MNGVNDGSLLLMRVVASPVVAEIIQDPDDVRFEFGYISGGFSPLPGGIRREGELRELNDPAFIANGEAAVQNLQIATVGQALGTRIVLAARFYKPPVEFDLNNPLSRLKERMLPLAIRVTGQVETVGAKPQSIFLVRPPVVLVHGLNSFPEAWTDAGNNSVVSALQSAGFFARDFRVGHQGPDPMRPEEGATLGYGEITDVYRWVGGAGFTDLVPGEPGKSMITRATEAFRRGHSIDPGSGDTQTVFFDGVGASTTGKRIAIQKVDVVAHSYGGLLSRWYVEQSGEFNDRRDVRKLITLGTPHLGGSLANLAAEVLKGGVIANARARGILGGRALNYPLGHLLCWLDRPEFRDGCPPNPGTVITSRLDGELPTALDAARTQLRHALQVVAVDSERLAQLNNSPFSDNVAYAAVIGTDVNIKTATNFFRAFQPMAPNGITSWFPWLYEFNRDDDATDGFVQVWSARLGVPSHNFHVEANHTGLQGNPQVNRRVIAWLNGADPNSGRALPVPLGSVQRAAVTNSGRRRWAAPISERNAYVGSYIDTDGISRGAGLRREAIVKVELDPQDSSPFYGTRRIVYGTQPDQVGAKPTVLTGMIRLGDVGAARLVHCHTSNFG